MAFNILYLHTHVTDLLQKEKKKKKKKKKEKKARSLTCRTREHYPNCNNHMPVLINEPTHEILAFLALRKLNLQTHIRSHPMGLHVPRLIFGQTLCLLPYFMCANSEGSGRAVSSEPSLFAYAISTIIS